MGNWVLNEGPKWLIMLIWFGINIGLFIGYFFYYQYQDGKQYFYVRQFIGFGLPFARGAAACLNFNCMLILLPVCRNLISYTRQYLCMCCKRNLRRQLDKNITFHKYIAYAICFFTAIHAGAHCFNVELFVEGYNSKSVNQSLLLSTLSLYTEPWVNPVRESNSNSIVEAVKLLPGTSGLIITLSLIIMVASATEFLRRSYFEVFWYTHHLFVIFFIGLVAHGMQGVIKKQINLDKHDPEECYKNPLQWGKQKDKCQVPLFSSSPASTWKWVLLPMILYFIERCIRIFRNFQNVDITKVVNHPSRVIELQMKKSGFMMSSGQYILIKCSVISRLEWHPFTLTSTPEDDYFSVHIRQVGDWTKKLAKLCSSDTEQPNLPKLAVDGPFGTASEDVFRYQVDVLVAAGIGATPFASVLKHIWHRYNQDMKLQKIYFYWICPDTNAFEWFAELLHSLEKQMIEDGREDFLNYNIYLSRGWDMNQAKNIILNKDDTYDTVTGLRQKTHYGRPQWDQIFSTIADDHPGVSIGCFFCGPKGLSTTLHKMCNEYSSPDVKGVHFFYNKENF